jgi:hypothetical protein
MPNNRCLHSFQVFCGGDSARTPSGAWNVKGQGEGQGASGTRAAKARYVARGRHVRGHV